MSTYTVNVRYEANGQPDRFTTDSPVKAGEIVYAKLGRAVVRHCRPLVEVNVYLQGGNVVIGRRTC